MLHSPTGTGEDVPGESDITFEDAMLDDYIYGPDASVAAKDGKSVHKPKLLPAPGEMTEAEFAEHKATHVKYDSRCPFCLAARRPNAQHQQSASERTIPILHSDYCFLRDSLSEDLLTVLVMYVKPYRTYMALPVDVKGPDALTIRRIARLLRANGLSHVVVRNDREPALRAVLASAAKSMNI